MIWKKRFLLAALTVIVLLMFSPSFVVAQCSMCRTALTGSAEGRDLAQGFNRGIVFLASVPFLIAGTLTLLVFQSTRHAATGIDKERRYKFFRDRVIRRLATCTKLETKFNVGGTSGAERLDPCNNSHCGEARGLKPTALFVPR